MGSRATGHTSERMADLARRELVRESGALFTGATLALLALEALTWAFGDFHPLDIGILVVWATSAVLAWRRLVPGHGLPWLWGALTAVTAAALCVQLSTEQSTVPFGYLLVVSAVFPPLTLFWRPVLVTGVVIVACVAGLGWLERDSGMWQPLTISDALLQVIAALLGGSVALYFRRRSLATTADATSILETRALTDGLTGVLNRQGIDELGRRLVDRADESAFALFVDINGLKQVNDRLGHDIGDDVIRDVAVAARHVVRANDLIGRWGGDEFVVLGVGAMPDPSVVESRMLTVLASLGATRQWTDGVSVGGACGTLDFDELIAAADADMYARRAGRRGTTPLR